MSIRTIPKKEIYTCDMCGKEYDNFEVFNLLKYKLWCPYMHRKIQAPQHQVMICTECFMNIKINLKKLARGEKK